MRNSENQMVVNFNLALMCCCRYMIASQASGPGWFVMHARRRATDPTTPDFH